MRTRRGHGRDAVLGAEHSLPEEQQASTAPARRFAFLSHNKNDAIEVRRLAAVLRSRNVNVWLDEDELLPGDPIADCLEEALRG